MALYESQWNPVNVGRNASKREPYNISSTHVSSSWVNKLLDGSGVRRVRMSHYFDMDKTVEIAKALDILAEDISSENADNEDPIEMIYDENEKYLKGTIKLMENAKDLWLGRTEFSSKIFPRVREALKFGASFHRERQDGTMKRIPPERIVGYICDEDDDDIITHYIEDPSIQTLDDQYNGRVRKTWGQYQTSEKDLITHPIDTLVVLKVGDGPYGESVLETVYKDWRRMCLVEDAILIYRVTRSTEKRVYYIDVGNLSGPRREKAIEQQRIRLMQKRSQKGKGIEAEYDPHATTEDIFIPTNSQGKGSRVENLPAGANLDQLSDLNHFTQKLAAGLRVPNSMMDIRSDQSREQWNDARVGTIYAVEMRYLGHVKRIARHFSTALDKAFKEFCKHRNVIVPKGISIKLNDPNSFAKYKDMEIFQQQLNLFSSAQQVQTLSKRYMLKKYMMMDDEELCRNEDMKLQELGLTPKQIKSMPPEHITNMVYGDQSVGKEYGIEPEEQQGGYGF